MLLYISITSATYCYDKKMYYIYRIQRNLNLMLYIKHHLINLT